MELTAFAARHRLLIRRDIDGTDIVPGANGSHIFEHGANTLGVVILRHDLSY